jgi:hypothetical protein
MGDPKTKPRLTTEHEKGKCVIAVHFNNREIARASGASMAEAAKWLVHHVNRIARETESLIIEANFLTEEEIDEAVLQDKERVASSAPA